ncbi:MAG: hypothetical protein GY749_25705 [Desulfobacteraceae bacterium]|nr:hypothetical protein [Desulfobacteraceae bacterium]
MSIHDLLNKMEAAEESFLDAEFLSPVLPGKQVQVRIAGLICKMHVTGKVKPGWAVLKPLSMDAAKIIGKPSLKQIRDYLSLFPAARLLLTARSDQDWLALPAHRNDTRFRTDGVVRVHLVTGAEVFHKIIVRFDGTHFWFQETDRRRSPAISAYLRDAMGDGIPPDSIRKSTLTAEEREAYRIIYKAVEDARRDHVEIRLEDALAHSGATLCSYIEREDAYTVSFNIDGQTHRSTVRKGDLTVLVAGICLDGHDKNFDLQSLVGVIREGTRRGAIHHVEDD